MCNRQKEDRWGHFARGDGSMDVKLQADCVFSIDRQMDKWEEW